MLRLVALRYHDTQIASEMRISAGTVKTIVARIKQKLELHSRAALIAAYDRMTTG